MKSNKNPHSQPSPFRPTSSLPGKQGLYDPTFEKDSCGVGMVARIGGERSHAIIRQALDVLGNLHHRGAQGSDPLTGDGAGILAQLPDALFREELALQSVTLPPSGQYGVGMIFLPRGVAELDSALRSIEAAAREASVQVLGWRDVPVDSSALGEQARASEPQIKQVFFTHAETEDLAFERVLYMLRRRIEKELEPQFGDSFHVVSLSSRTIVYKGLLLPGQVARYFLDLRDSRFISALALVHSRFSTNTFPSWPRAHPYRYLCHNGEINTIQGNINWMRARHGGLSSDVFGPSLSKAFPIVGEGQSDSACLDNALEFMVLGGRSLPHAMMMLIPEPWAGNATMDPARRAFYEYHSALMEPWDGPAAVCFTDGELIGATLDRNGLRPCRWQITDDNTVILASEAGTLPIPAAKIRKKGRLEPGKMFLVDTKAGRIIGDDELKAKLAAEHPYREWADAHRLKLSKLQFPNLKVPAPIAGEERTRLQHSFGYTTEELKMVLAPMGANGEEPTSSMGNDTPIAALSKRPQLLFKYFRQLFAQVTNPPIDPIREQLVMSLSANVGARANLLAREPDSANWKQVQLEQPILTHDDLARIRAIGGSDGDPALRAVTLKLLFRADEGAHGMRQALTRLCRQASQAVREGSRLLILSDRGVNDEWAPIPSLLGVSAVHHHLVGKSQRAGCGLIIETGEARDVHHFACLLAYGAGSIQPYLALDSLPAEDHANYIKAVGKGLLKIFSKMGISTLQSYCGAQIFEAVGLGSAFVKHYFTGTPTRIQGAALADIAEQTLIRHREAFSRDFGLPTGGEIHYRSGGEHHEWNPETIASLQHATRSNDPKTFQEFSDRVNGARTTLRSRLDFRFDKKAVPLTEVEPAAEIVRRFTTGAMSLGALSPESHETLAVAMNRIGAKSNSGEGGEDAARFHPDAKGDSRNSAIKQIASARFGVTAHYLVNARELQIKMAQGAKPGEGGQLPGPKVDENIARLRYSTPGVGLISPPPHHDIYSIEDLAQLIFDLKNVNPEADVSVKLVSEVGVGTIAAGVAKAHADKILISGDSGGTGASPLSSIKYAGAPWELGLAETHQTLVLNGLRSRVKLETDGQLKTGRDVVVAALLGAEEFGFSTAPLIVQGCIMMRKCHLNTCPVGVATQDPELRRKFTGQPEHVINFFFFIAEEVRSLMAQLGFRRFEELIGRADRLKTSPSESEPGSLENGVDLSPLLHRPRLDLPETERHYGGKRPRALDHVLDRRLIALCQPALERGEPVKLDFPIHNTDRATGTMLSGRVAKLHGAQGLPEDTIRLGFQGSAGQSFGAFLASGIRLHLEGESNDYIGKGLSGGKIVVVPPRDAGYAPDGPDGVTIVGNTSLYGATAGEAFIRGRAGERFAVRNSGAVAVVEGVGDHGCEYMTGGRVVVLGSTGRNFAAGMSGGIAYVLVDEKPGSFTARCNLAMVELETVASLAAPEYGSEGEAASRELRALVERHLEQTGSPKAAALLADWNRAIERFVRVMPLDYKKALTARATTSRRAVVLDAQPEKKEAVTHV